MSLCRRPGSDIQSVNIYQDSAQAALTPAGPRMERMSPHTPSSFLRGLGHCTTSAEDPWDPPRDQGDSGGQNPPAHRDAASSTSGSASFHVPMGPDFTSLDSSECVHPSPQSQRSDGRGVQEVLALPVTSPPSPLTLSWHWRWHLCEFNKIMSSSLSVFYTPGT